MYQLSDNPRRDIHNSTFNVPKGNTITSFPGAGRRKQAALGMLLILEQANKLSWRSREC